ncbi:unnamed protein product [Polarella glacialis]|uniref:Ion transport domain-containing protein n=1 Tax=Polarella glacialis TaxID=89957 RepID=A0A813GW98_POLGL|nr:unnamed protein product [Polarella glacialis]
MGKSESSPGVVTQTLLPTGSGRAAGSSWSSCSDDASSEDATGSDSAGGQDPFGERCSAERTPCQLCRLWVWMFFNGYEGAPVALRRAAVLYQGIMGLLLVLLFVADRATDVKVTTEWYWYSELVITIIWSLEFLLRAWSDEDKSLLEVRQPGTRLMLRLRSLMRVLKLLELRGFAALRMLRLVSLLRLERDWHFLQPVLEVFRNEAYHLAATLGLALMVLLFSAVIMFYIESAAEDTQFDSVGSSLWWATAALTTVGYGDIYPKTPVGRFVGGLFALPAGMLASGFQDVVRRKNTGDLDMDQAYGSRLDAMTARIDARFDEHLGKMGEHMGKLSARIDALASSVDSLQGGMNSIKAEIITTPRS